MMRRLTLGAMLGLQSLHTPYRMEKIDMIQTLSTKTIAIILLVQNHVLDDTESDRTMVSIRPCKTEKKI